MAKPLASDELWEIVPPLLPAPKPRRFRNWGRQPLDERAGGVPLGGGANPGVAASVPPAAGTLRRPR